MSTSEAMTSTAIVPSAPTPSTVRASPQAAAPSIRRPVATTLTVVVLAMFAASWLFAVLSDNTPAHYDSATNFLRAMNIRNFVRSGDIDGALRWYWYYPNGESWIVNAFFATFGATYRAAVLSNIVWIGTLARGLVLLARRTSLQPTGRLVLISIVFGAPIVIGSTHELILDLPTLALFVSLLVSLRSVPERTDQSAWLRPATVAGCCLLIKWSSLPWVLSAVGVELCFRRRRSMPIRVTGGERPATRRTMLSFTIVVGACLWWYGGNHTALLQDIVTRGINAGIAEGDPQGVGLNSLRFYGSAFLTSYAWLPMAVTLCCLFARSRGRMSRGKIDERQSWLTTAVLGIGVPNLLFLLWQSNKDARYAMPIIVLLGLVAARATERLHVRTRTGFSAVFAAIALGNIVSLNGPWGTDSWSWKSFPIVGANGYTAPRPTSRDAVYDAVVNHIEQLREERGCARTFVVRDEVLGVWINHRTMAARLVERGWTWADPGLGCIGIVITAPGGTSDAGAATVGISTAARRAFPSTGGTIWVVSAAPD
jgi:hypothetical protein